MTASHGCVVFVYGKRSAAIRAIKLNQIHVPNARLSTPTVVRLGSCRQPHLKRKIPSAIATFRLRPGRASYIRNWRHGDRDGPRNDGVANEYCSTCSYVFAVNCLSALASLRPSLTLVALSGYRYAIGVSRPWSRIILPSKLARVHDMRDFWCCTR